MPTRWVRAWILSFLFVCGLAACNSPLAQVLMFCVFFALFLLSVQGLRALSAREGEGLLTCGRLAGTERLASTHGAYNAERDELSPFEWSN